MTNDLDRCVFEHPSLVTLASAVFRLTEGDRVPSLSIRLDESDALVPIDALTKLFGIARDSPDGIKLNLVAQALRFVPSLRMGDPLPAEVLTGEASWQPSNYHRQVASARLQMQLLEWIGGTGEAQQITSQMLVVSVGDPSIRPRVQQALRDAAQQLGVCGGGPAVAALLEELAVEVAYIEALRERLLTRVQALARRFNRVSQEAGAVAAARRETLFQVTRLATMGLAQLTARFDQVDAQTGEILSALRNLEQQRNFLRPHRDWLHCTLMAWEPLLKEWESIPGPPGEDRLWRMLDKAYRFLAPRYMTVQEWHAVPTLLPGAERSKVVVW